MSQRKKEDRELEKKSKSINAEGLAIRSSPIILQPAEKRQDYKGLVKRLLRKYSREEKSPIPQQVKPMLATISGEAFNDKDWLFEIKWDGYRAIASINEQEVSLHSRNTLSFNEKFAPVVKALEEWGVPAVLDGEVVILNGSGKADFGALQQWGKTGNGILNYYVFDLLWLGGIDLRDKPLVERRKLLQQILPESGTIRYSDDIEEYGIDFFKMAKGSGLEGIIAKRKDATYLDGQRSANWLKIKAEERHEAVICGYTKKRDTDRLFSSLLLGIPQKKGFQFIGQVGTGFSQASQKELLQRMNPLVIKGCPLIKCPSLSDPVVWVKPQLIGEVKYTELTKEGVMRHPSFQGLREDKTVKDYNGLEKKATAPLFSPGDETAVVDICEHSLKLTNLQKKFWIKENISKGDLLSYYHAVGSYIMPYLEDRPQSLNRFPNGIDGKNFYHKNMAGKLEPWLKTFRRVSESTLLPNYFLVCADKAHLLYMVNLGCIEINPWHSTTHLPHNPSWCVIDLDPGNISFKRVVETALVVKEVLDSLGVVSYPKTSGSTGIHIYIPLGQRYTYEQSKRLAELVVNMVHEQLPGTTSIERSPAKRPDKIYLDYLQNRPIQTICSPYSVRPKKGATVSAPLHWSEVNDSLKMENFTLKNMRERLKTEGDLFKGVLDRGIDLNHALHQLAKLLKHKS
ncbi:MAG: Bifunctional non-ous end joining protein LigD [Flaviaesturariibacter sp.]|nr:Bifunctional non-ous end joining protein LigD [Flaviaesturariibacter sp.]